MALALPSLLSFSLIVVGAAFIAQWRQEVRSSSLRARLHQKSIRNNKIVIAVMVMVFMAALSGLLLPLVALIALGTAGFWWHKKRQKRLGLPYDLDLVVRLEAIAASLHSGSGLTIALTDAGRRNGHSATDVREVVEAIHTGSAVTSALAGWKKRRKRWSVDIAVTACMVSLQGGGSHAASVEAAADAIRDVIEADSIVRTSAAQANASAIALSCLPVLVLIGTSTADPHVRSFLVTPLGLAVLAVGFSLDALGLYLMRRATEAALT